jgi:hypothetical protein
MIVQEALTIIGRTKERKNVVSYVTTTMGQKMKHTTGG